MMHGTTIVCVRKNGQVAMGGDGQVSLGDAAVKHTAKKIRRLGERRDILAGFAGSTADAFTLFEKFETKLREHGHNLMRAAVELAKDWRTDKFLRRLEAVLLVADRERLLMISGAGDVLEPDGDVLAVGSGGGYARAAATALLRHADLNAAETVRAALAVAAEICIYTNDHAQIEEL